MFINTLVVRLKEHKFFSEFFTESAMKQFKKYLIVGFSTFAIEYSIFRISLIIFENTMIFSSDKLVNAQFANVVGYSISFMYNFLMNRYWSFQSKSNLYKQLMSYGILFGFNLLATAGILYLFKTTFGIMPEFSKLIAMGAIVCWNFVFYRKIIYKN